MTVLPFSTMRKGLSVARVAGALVISAGCGGSTKSTSGTDVSGTEATSTSGAADTTSSTGKMTVRTIPTHSARGLPAQPYFIIDAVGVGENSYVTLTNFTDQPET